MTCPVNASALSRPIYAEKVIYAQTYKEAIFKPSPRLNLILAPNGSVSNPSNLS